MGAANCCKKPDEIVVEEVKYSPTDNNKFTAIDQDSYPQDTKPVQRSNVNYEDETNQNQAVSNQNLYEQEGGSPNIGGAYEVPINVSNPQQNYEEGYESNQMGPIQQYDNMQVVQGTNINQYQQDDQAAYQYIENQDMNANINSPMSGEGNAYAGLKEQEGIDYNELVNQVGNEANLKALGLANAGLKTASSSAAYNNINNMGGINLNTLQSVQQQGGLDLNALNLGAQQGANTTSQITTTKKVEYNNLGTTGQQTTTTTTTTIKKQIDSSQQNESEDLSKYFQQATSKFGSVNAQGKEDIENYYSTEKESTPLVDLKQLANSANALVPGGLNLDKSVQQDNLPTQTKVTKVTAVKQIPSNDDINKYFKQTNSTSVNQSSLPAKIKASANLQVSAQENLDKYFQNAGPADANKEEKATTEVKKSEEQPNTDNLNQIKITKIELDMDDLPETFGSSNIANFKQTTTTTTTKTTGIGDKPAQTTTTTTTKTVGNIDMKDLPEVFGSFDINKYKQPVTTTKTEEIKVEKKNVESPDNNNFKQTTTTTKTFGNIALDMKDLPEVFGSSDINKFKQTTTTTTTVKKGGDIDMKDLPQDLGSSDNNNFKQTTTTTTTKTVGNADLKDFNIDLTNYKLDMEDLPEVIGSSDISHFKQTTTTTTTTKKEGGDLDKKEDNKQITTTTTERIIDMKDLPEVFGSSDIGKFKQTTTTTTTTKKEGGDLQNKESNKDDVKQITTTTTTEGIIDMKDLPEVFGSFNIAHFKQPSIEGQLDNKELTKGIDTSNLKNVKQTTVTTTKEGANIDMKDLPETFGSSNINNFKQTTTTTTTTGVLDMKDLPETFGSSNINNFKQTTTTTKTTGVLDMKDLPETFGSSNINNFKQTETKTTTIKTTGNAPIDLNQFSLEKNDSAMSNIKNITKTTKVETSNAGNIDLKQFGIEQNPSANPITGTEDYSKYFKTTSQITSGPIDLKQFGIEQNASASPITGNEDYSKYFQTTKTTTTKTSGPTGVSSGTTADQHKTTTTTTTTKTTNIGVPTFSTAGFTNSYRIPNATANNVISYGTTQDATSNYNTYGEKKVTTTKVVKSHVAPTQSTQSYSYNYSYQMPTTTKTTVTKTTYSGAA